VAHPRLCRLEPQVLRRELLCVTAAWHGVFVFVIAIAAIALGVAAAAAATATTVATIVVGGFVIIIVTMSSPLTPSCLILL